MVGFSSAYAQRSGTPIDQERVKAARVAYITTRINLKPEQAEKFWPLFHAFTSARESSMHTIAALGRGIESVTEEEAKSRIQQKLQLQQKLIQEEKSFVTEAAKTLTYKQLLALQTIAKDFNRHLYERGRERGK